MGVPSPATLRELMLPIHGDNSKFYQEMEKNHLKMREGLKIQY